MPGFEAVFVAGGKEISQILIENCGMLGMPVKDTQGKTIGNVVRHDYDESGVYTIQIQFEKNVTEEIIKNKKLVV